MAAAGRHRVSPQKKMKSNTDDSKTANLGRLGELRIVAADTVSLFRHLSLRRRRQLMLLAVLQVVGAFSEVVSLGAVLPFLAALINAKALLARSEISWLLHLFNIETEVEIIILMAVTFSLAIIVVNFLRMATLRIQTQLAAAISSDLIEDVYRRTLMQPYQFHTDVNSGKLQSEIIYDFNVAMSTVLGVMMLITQGLVMGSIILALLALDPVVAVGMGTVAAVAYMVITRITTKRLVARGKIMSDKYHGMLKTLNEGYGGIRDVVLSGQQQQFVAEFRRTDRPIRQATADTQFIRAVPRYILETVMVVALSMSTAALAWWTGDISGTLPILGAIGLAANRMLPAMQQVYVSLSGMQGSHISLKRTLSALSRVPDPVAIISPEGPATLKSSVSLQGIWFRYAPTQSDDGDADWILKDVSLEVPVNKTVALVGTTGSGKSTISDVLLGLLRPQSGLMLLDGVPMDDTMLAAWRRSIAHVPQSVYLSDTTFKENIAFGVPRDLIDMDRVREAAKSAHIAEFIEGRPLGYDETIGERGIRLSGGQRQRLGIARALYRNAQMIVFDEATSSLDNATEWAVMEAIHELSNRMTVVLIAHRLSTVRDADIIFEIGKGRIIASGTFDELMNTSASFRSMTMTDTL